MVKKMKILRRRWGGGGGAYVKFPPWWGYGYFLESHIKQFGSYLKVGVS